MSSITEARAQAELDSERLRQIAEWLRMEQGHEETARRVELIADRHDALAALPETPRPQDISTDDRHDSDCATHNEPAYPNGPCDCRLSDHEAVRQAVADAIDAAAVITPRNEFLGGSTIANLAEVADAVLKVLPATRRPSPPTEEQVEVAEIAYEQAMQEHAKHRLALRAALEAAARVGGER